MTRDIVVNSGMGRQAAATVLIVDDDALTVENYARMLRLEGYQVRTAESAEGGLREAAVTRPDAIILDLRMPMIDGLEFLRRLRADADQLATPVAVVTGDYLLDDDLSAALRQLGAELRFKPLWPEDLVSLADHLVSR